MLNMPFFSHSYIVHYYDGSKRKPDFKTVWKGMPNYHIFHFCFIREIWPTFGHSRVVNVAVADKFFSSRSCLLLT